MQRMLVYQQNITVTRIDEVNSVPLNAGQVRLRLDSFALTANNVTYAASGFAIGYWKFFPSGVEGHGIVPVWGTGTVIESNSEALAVGTRLYGFYPLADELVITPRQTSAGTFEDVTAHRADLPAVYNRYVPVDTDEAQDHLRALLQPLLATSWLLADWLRDNDGFGARQIIVGSASSKTGLGLCKFLSETQGKGFWTVGLTSYANYDFVKRLGACDDVLTYDQVSEIAREPSVYVDMAGNSAVKLALHDHLRDHLKHSAAVGISHWDRFRAKQEVPGVKPQFFFAPAQIAKRREDWGPGVVEREINAAWERIAANANWLEITQHHGIAEALPVYASLADGRADPSHGHVVSLG